MEMSIDGVQEVWWARLGPGRFRPDSSGFGWGYRVSISISGRLMLWSVQCIYFLTFYVQLLILSVFFCSPVWQLGGIKCHEFFCSLFFHA